MDPQTFQYHSAYSDHGTQEESSQKAMTSLQSQGTIPRSIPRSLLAKQWKASQILASIFCFVSFLGSTWAFWKSGYRNCDNESPYGQAYRSGLYSGVICVFAHATAYGTWADSGTLDTKVILTNEAKRRRIVRMPVVVQIAAFSQVVAAGMNAMAVHRTVSLLGESHLVPITATVATVSCLVASIYNFFVANEIHTAFRTAASHKSYDKPKTIQFDGPDMSASPLVYDTTLGNFRNLPAFEQQWLLVHAFSGMSLACMHLTGSCLLWITTCASDARQPILSLAEASQNNKTNWFAAMFMATTVFSSRIGCLQPKAGLKLPRWALVLSQLIFLTGASDLGFATYLSSGPWYTLSVLRLQTGFTAVIFLMCSAYEVVFMLKPEQKVSIAQGGTRDMIALPPVNKLVADVHGNQQI